jgi:hypothetical protein
MKRVALLLTLATLAACRKTPDVPVPPPPRPASVTDASIAEEKKNVLSIINGAVVIDRSGELTLSSSAILALDSTPTTGWVTAPHDSNSWVTVELASRTRISAISLDSSFGAPPARPKSVELAASGDGALFTRIATLDFAAGERQRFEIAPFEARYIRLTILSNRGGDVATAVGTFGAEGTRIDAAPKGEISGRWLLDGVEQLELAQNGSTVLGRIDIPSPIFLLGDLKDGYIRYMWVRANQAGYGVMSVNGAGDALNGIWWHERPLNLFFGNSTYGRRTGEAGAVGIDGRFVQTAIAELGRCSLFPLRFSARNDELEEGSQLLAMAVQAAAADPARQYRLTSYAFGHGASAANRAVSEARVATMRRLLPALPRNVQLHAAGDAPPRLWDPPRCPVDVTLYDRVDLELIISDTQQPR